MVFVKSYKSIDFQFLFHLASTRAPLLKSLFRGYVISGALVLTEKHFTIFENQVGGASPSHHCHHGSVALPRGPPSPRLPGKRGSYSWPHLVVVVVVFAVVVVEKYTIKQSRR